MPVKRGAALCKTVNYSGCRELCMAATSCKRAEQKGKCRLLSEVGGGRRWRGVEGGNTTKENRFGMTRTVFSSPIF